MVWDSESAIVALAQRLAYQHGLEQLPYQMSERQLVVLSDESVEWSVFTKRAFNIPMWCKLVSHSDQLSTSSQIHSKEGRV